MVDVDLLVRGGTLVTPGGVGMGDLAIRDGRIVAIGDLASHRAPDVLDGAGLHVLPGVIDSRVHLGEPGYEKFEDMASGTAAAALGGVTTVLDLPDNDPATTTAAALAEKCRRAKNRVWTDIAFFVGAAVADNTMLAPLENAPGSAGIDVTIPATATDVDLGALLANGRRRLAVDGLDGDTAGRLLRLAKAVKRRVHLHMADPAGFGDYLCEFRDFATFSTTPLDLGGPVSAGLWRALGQGGLDCLCSNHRPRNQRGGDADSGPGVQTLVPVMLDHVRAGRLSLERFVDLTSAGPARAFGIAGKGRIAVGFDADLTIVDLAARRTLRDQWIISRCGWTPHDGQSLTGWPVMTVIGGRIVMHDGALIGDPAGKVVRFLEAL